MDKQEILKEMSMTYDELVDYLWKKYGRAKYDYFSTPECRSKSKKIRRTSEGLFVHHVDEDKGMRLSDSSWAKEQPWEYQKAERLVYCNYIEHLLLHIQITKMRLTEPEGIAQKSSQWDQSSLRSLIQPGVWLICQEINPLYKNKGSTKMRLTEPEGIAQKSSQWDQSSLRSLIQPGVWLICQEINPLYKNKGSTTKWRDNCYKQISDNQTEYNMIIDSLVGMVDANYSGIKRKKRIEVGDIIVDSRTNKEGKVIWLEERNFFVLIALSSEGKKIPVVMNRTDYIGYNEALAELKNELVTTGLEERKQTPKMDTSFAVKA